MLFEDPESPLSVGQPGRARTLDLPHSSLVTLYQLSKPGGCFQVGLLGKLVIDKNQTMKVRWVWHPEALHEYHLVAWRFD